MRDAVTEHLRHVEHHRRLLRREAATIEGSDTFGLLWRPRAILERVNELEQNSARKVDYLNYLLDNDKF